MSGPLAAVVACLAASSALALAMPPRTRLGARPVAAPAQRPDQDWLRRWRLLWVLLAGTAAGVAVGGTAAWLAAPAAGIAVWLVIERSEPQGVRSARDEARRDLPHLVGLLADALRTGQAPSDALAVVAGALPGPASTRLAEAVPRLRLGVDPAAVWADLAADDSLGPLGRALARAHRSGAPVVPAIERLAEELARSARAEVEDRARAVGVKAAVPLGVCLLPAFVLIGIVPVVAGLLATLGL